MVVAAVGYGLWLRFDDLDRKILWYDEVGTLLRLSGHGEAELPALHDGRSRRAGDVLDTFQRANGTVAQVVGTVAIEEPQSGGGYFAVAALWSGVGASLVAQRAGDPDAETVVRTRALSAVASTLSLVLLYLVCRRLCVRPAAAALVAALAALSPLQIRYAQELRSYATWSTFLLAAALVLTQARERGGVAAWGAFAAFLAACLWTQPLSLLLLVPFAALALVPGSDAHTAQPSRSRTWRSPRLAPFVAATAVALLAWLPWAWTIVANRDTLTRTTAWSGEGPSALARARAWLGVLTSIFFRPGGEGGLFSGLVSPASVGALALWAALGLAVLVLLSLAIRHLWRNEAPVTRGFLLSLAVVPFATLAIADLVGGGRRSTVDRYLLPSWLAIELIVAIYLTAGSATSRSERGSGSRPSYWRSGVALALLVLGAATGARTHAVPIWWNTEPDGMHRLVAVGDRLAALDDVVIVTDLPALRLLQLAHHLDRRATVRLGPAAASAIAADEWRRVVLVQPSEALLDVIRGSAGAERHVVREDDGLPIWRVVARGGG